MVLGFLVIVAVLSAFQWKVVDLRNVVPTFRWTTDSQIASLTPGWIAALDSAAKDAAARTSRTSWRSSKTLTQRAREPGPQGDRSRRRQSWRRSAAAPSPGALATEIRGHAAASAGEQSLRARQSDEGPHRRRRLSDRHARSGSRWSAGRVVPFLIGLPAIFAARLARAPPRRQRPVRRLGHRIRHLRAAARPPDQQHDRHAGVAEARGADRVLHQDRPRHSRREPAVPRGAAGRRARHRAGGAGRCSWSGTRASGCARKLKVDDEFAAMLSTAVSICGVSAAIAACGAIQGDKKKLSYVTSLVLIVAVPMMIVMPWIAKSTGMDDLVAGAWLGGTLDTSASVVAAGALISGRRHEDRRDREVLAERADRRRRLRAGDLVDVQVRRRDRRAAERRRDLGALPEIRARLRRSRRRCSRSRCHPNWSPAPAARSARSAPGGSRSPSSASGSRRASSSLRPTSRAGPALAFLGAQGIQRDLDAAARVAAVRRRDRGAAGDQLILFRLRIPSLSGPPPTPVATPQASSPAAFALMTTTTTGAAPLPRTCPSPCRCRRRCRGRRST